MALTPPINGGQYIFTIPSDPSGFAIQPTAILTIGSQARATYSSGSINVSDYRELAIDFNVTALTGGTSPTVTFKISRFGADGVLYQIVSATALNAAGTISYDIGAGLSTNKSFINLVQIDMVVTGTPTSITFSGSVYGK